MPHAPLSVDHLERTATVDVDIVVPVYNEEAGLELSVRRLHAYLRDRFPLTWTVTIADNASTDRTWGIACRLASSLPGVRAMHLPEKGRGRALRAAWGESEATVVAYMDVDLSTSLDALLPLVAPLLSGHSDVAIGSRLAPGARVVRGPRREVISRIYNAILHATLRNGFSDAQCGFKAVRADVARVLMPMVADQGWFFDTELLALAEHNGLRIAEIPVDWVDDPDSRVDVVGTAVTDLKGVARVLRERSAGLGTVPDGSLPDHEGPDPAITGQVVRFAQVGVVSTLVFAVLVLALWTSLGPVGADLVALALTAIANLAAHRRLTFARRGRAGRARHYRAGLALNLVPLAANIAVVATLGGAGRWVDLGVLTLTNAVATVGRFVALRRWVFDR